MTNLSLSSDGTAGAGANRLSLQQRRTLIVGTIVIITIAIAIAMYQRVAPDMRLKADGYSRLGAAQGYDVWAKVSGDRVFVHVPDRNGGDLCASTGDFTPASIPLCTDQFDGRSVFVAVAPRSASATIITAEGSELPATLVQEPGWKYALAVRVAQNDSLFGARLK